MLESIKYQPLLIGYMFNSIRQLTLHLRRREIEQKYTEEPA
jgi:hypothetical protein